MENAYIILGRMSDGELRDCQALVGVFFGAQQPTGKQLKQMGFGRVSQIDQAKTNGDAPAEPTIFLFDRTPAAREVTKAEVIFDGKKAKLGKKEKIKGEPNSIVPEVQGALAARLLTPRNGLSSRDLKKNARPPKRDKGTFQMKAGRA
jgi:hypothetical protein